MKILKYAIITILVLICGTVALNTGLKKYSLHFGRKVRISGTLPQDFELDISTVFESSDCFHYKPEWRDIPLSTYKFTDVAYDRESSTYSAHALLEYKELFCTWSPSLITIRGFHPSRDAEHYQSFHITAVHVSSRISTNKTHVAICHRSGGYSDTPDVQKMYCEQPKPQRFFYLDGDFNDYITLDIKLVD